MNRFTQVAYYSWRDSNWFCSNIMVHVIKLLEKLPYIGPRRIEARAQARLNLINSWMDMNPKLTREQATRLTDELINE